MTATPPVNGATILVTGGAGFIGSHLSLNLARSGAAVVALDNLRRRGSELNVPRLHDAGVEFRKGDVRVESDVAVPGRTFDWIIDCAAEPSVVAGYGDGSKYVVDTNLVGTTHCLELARAQRARVVFLSTSRVYPTARLNALAFRETATRFELDSIQPEPGASGRGVSELLSLVGTRTLYGATKLASELLLAEYGDANGVEFVINRLGVVSGPRQMGKVEQGIFALVMARHLFGGELRFIGWGGAGKQVRDLVHVDDVWTLVATEIAEWAKARGQTFNAGGGRGVSLSLREAVDLCGEITGAAPTVTSDPSTRHGDVRVYLSDSSAVEAALGWKPTRDARRILEDVRDWMVGDADRLREFFA